MELADVLYACSCIAGISTIPVRVYQNNEVRQSYGLENMPVDPIKPYQKLLLSKEGSVSYYSNPFFQFYGVVKHQALLSTSLLWQKKSRGQRTYLKIQTNP